MTINFKNKVAVVTGAGKCHALELARRGAKVVVNDLGGGTEGTGNSTAPAQHVYAANGIILQAVSGNYQRVAIVESKGKQLGSNASVEDVAKHFDAITDLSGAKPKNSAA